MAETTVDLGRGKKAGKYSVTPDQILGAAARSALRHGLGEEGARVVQAILKTEGGLTGATGDVEGGGSYGPAQLYWQGELGNLANDLGVSLREAANWVQTHPIESVDWALGSYLGGAIKRGLKAGLTGHELATFAQKVGQRSVSPERAGQVYQALFGAGGGLLGASVAEAAELDQSEAQRGGDGVDTTGDRPPSSFEPPSRAAASTSGPVTRADRMRARIDELRRQRAALEPRIAELRQPSERETPASLTADDVMVAQSARQDRVNELNTVLGQANSIDAAIRSAETDLANDPDPRASTQDPVTAERAKVELDRAKVDLQRAQQQAALATSPEAKRAQELEVKKAEVALQQAQIALQKAQRPDVHISGKHAITVGQDGAITTQRVLPDDPRYPQAHVGGNRVVTIDPYTGQMTGNQIIDPEAQGLALEKARRDLMGQQQLLVQNHFALLADLQKKVASGEMDSAEADGFIAQSKAYTDAALQGTTPFQIKKQAEDSARMARQQGIDVLNQRLSTGGSLANSLLSSAVGLVNGGALPVPGHGPYGVDPLGYAKSFLNDPDVGGGPDVSDFAKKLLMASRPLPAGL